MSKIFISYRREDTAGYAISLHDRLAARFGAEQVFMDIDNIDFGDDFVDVIKEKISACDVLLVLIGRNWLTSKDASGRRRLDSPDDFVRLEVAAALERKIRVIPVLFAGAVPPMRDDLPADMAPLSRRNAITISDAAFHQDVVRLLDSIATVITPPATNPVSVRPETEQRAEGIVSRRGAASTRGRDTSVAEAAGRAVTMRKDLPGNVVERAGTRGAAQTSETSPATVRQVAARVAEAKAIQRTGIQVYCEKPWSGMGADPECYITLATGYSQRNQLKWEMDVFIPLEPHEGYSLAIKRPSDLLSYKASINFSLEPGEVKKFRYESPPISFMSGEIEPKD